MVNRLPASATEELEAKRERGSLSEDWASSVVCGLKPSVGGEKCTSIGVGQVLQQRPGIAATLQSLALAPKIYGPGSCLCTTATESINFEAMGLHALPAKDVASPEQLARILSNFGGHFGGGSMDGLAIAQRRPQRRAEKIFLGMPDARHNSSAAMGTCLASAAFRFIRQNGVDVAHSVHWRGRLSILRMVKQKKTRDAEADMFPTPAQRRAALARGYAAACSFLKERKLMPSSASSSQAA
eukprot:g8800.t1